MNRKFNAFPLNDVLCAFTAARGFSGCQINTERNTARGFTLAEVLITLTIIGVIAAITIPNLYSKYQKHTYVVGLKKAHSQLQNAVRMIPIEEGCPAGDFECAGFISESGKATDIDGQNFENSPYRKALYLISKHIKLHHFCSGTYADKRSNCYRKMYKTDRAHDPFYDVMYWTPEDGFISQDGMMWTIKLSSSNDYNQNFILVDINGKQGPNQPGRDTFRFYISATAKNGLPAGTVIPAGSKLNHKYYGWSWTNTCATNNLILDCTGKVLEEDAMNY